MILFQLYFDVSAEQAEQFESTYAEVFLPALRKQQGFIHSKLLRSYPPAVGAKIEAVPTEFNYQCNFVFESEQHRQRWASSEDHDTAWPKLSSFARKVGWRGYDLLHDTLAE